MNPFTPLARIAAYALTVLALAAAAHGTADAAEVHRAPVVKTVVTWSGPECLAFVHYATPDGRARYERVCEADKTATFEFDGEAGRTVGIDPLFSEPNQVIVCRTYEVGTGRVFVESSGVQGRGDVVSCSGTMD